MTTTTMTANFSSNGTFVYSHDLSCWETTIGQEMVKLTVMDTVVTVATVFFIDYVRDIFVRYGNNCWCWDFETIAFTIAITL